MRPALALPLGLAAAGVSAATYGWAYERKAFRLRRVEVPILAPGSPRLTVLHVSDLHATPGQPWKVSWVRSLAELEPDLVINTGDNLASMHGAPVVLEALGPLLERPGAFVPGSNDWFAPVPKNPARYLLPHDDRATTARRCRGARCAHRSPPPAGSTSPIDVRRSSFAAFTVELAGVSDAHLDADHYDRIAGAATGDVAIGLSHCPEPRVHRRVRRRRLLAGDERSHPRRPAASAGVRRAGDELRARATPGARPVALARRRLAARLGRSRDLAVRAGALRLPARGDLADPNSARAVRDLP